MITLPSRLENFRLQSTKQLCTLWQLTRSDGVILRFCERDCIITFEGETFTPIGGMQSTAKQLQEGLQTRNFEAVGIIDSDDITQDDLRAGRYREAEIHERLIDARYPFAGALFETKYWISEITFDGKIWNAQVQGPERWLRMNVGDLIGRNCRWDLGDAHCLASLGTFTHNGAVTSITTQRLSFVTNLSSTEATTYAYGKFTWLTGANAGIVCECKAYTSGHLVTLQLQTPFDIQVGDTFTAIAGCDKTFEMCRVRFDNVIHFGGFPHTPGTEKLISTPNAV